MESLTRGLLFILVLALGCLSNGLTAPVDTTEGQRAWLEKYNYLSRGSIREASSPQSEVESLKAGVRKLQGFVGLPQTGIVDDHTKTYMLKRRCGLPDFASAASFSERKKRYAIAGHRYAPGSVVTYRINEYSKKLPRTLQDQIFSYAFEYWYKVANISFRKIMDSSIIAEIDILFTKGNHGDSLPFDGPGTIIAHAFFPHEGGDEHYDEDEDWTHQSSQGENLLQTAVHEIGHSLGLLHTNDRSAVMYPFTKPYDPYFQLGTDDIQGIQSLYGPSVLPATAFPKTTTTTETTITTQSCLTTYTVARNTSSASGIQIPSPNDTPLECQAYCTNEPACVGFDLDTNSNPNICRWHRESTFGFRNIINFPSPQGINQYAKVENCSTSNTQSTPTTSGKCMTIYGFEHNIQSAGGILVHPPYDSPLECQAFCTNKPDCAGFDFDTSVIPNVCFWHTQNTFSTKHATLHPSHGFYQFYKEKQCQISEKCFTFYTFEYNTFSYGGIAVPTFHSSHLECQNYCTNEPNCYGFDLDTNKDPIVCFWHRENTFEDRLINLNYSQGIHQYMKLQHCYTSGGCADNYTSAPNTGSTDGQLLGTGVSLLDCIYLCNHLPFSLCQAFDYDRSLQTCYYHSNNYMTLLYQSEHGLNQCRRNNICRTTK